MDQWVKRLMTIHNSLHPRDDMNYMCQEKKEEKNLLALRISSMYQNKDSIIIQKWAKRD